MIKLIGINFNFCQISARTKANKTKQENKINTKSNLEVENKQEKKKRKEKKNANLINTTGINPDKQDHLTGLLQLLEAQVLKMVSNVGH